MYTHACTYRQNKKSKQITTKYPLINHKIVRMPGATQELLKPQYSSQYSSGSPPVKNLFLERK